MEGKYLMFPSGEVSRLSCASQGDFQCDNGQCIRSYHICNGKTDCDDKSDEATDTGAKCSQSNQLSI